MFLILESYYGYLAESLREYSTDIQMTHYNFQAQLVVEYYWWPESSFYIEGSDKKIRYDINNAPGPGAYEGGLMKSNKNIRIG